ncbi:hypothetical protein OMP44_09175 [Pseudomonas sp. CBMAI 2609]|uniref:Uncharacterized protein n=1 Tax=Pseudomonas flavocrustae TaxID=2991719 RepID=A0ABT6IEZ9_9PSED|nr:hypothetical protein [Pseudomonas sp. CBMAI 2609]MDH4763067.1 hypothetical protein [Pseudomonas sp. CBMAI 2609]
MRRRLDVTLSHNGGQPLVVSNDGALGVVDFWTPAELRELARALNVLATDAERHGCGDLRLIRELGTGRPAEF